MMETARDDALSRALPCNFEAERAVIGAALINNQTFGVIGSRLAAEHFAEEIHRRIWETMSKLIGDGKAVTPITLKTFLGDHDLGGITVPQYLARLAAEATTVINAPSYAEQIAALHARRGMIAALQEAIEVAYDPPVTLSVGGMADRAIEALRTVADATPDAVAQESIDETLGQLIEAAQDRLAGVVVTVPSSGLVDFDRRLSGGLLPGRLIVLAARPGMGKTVLMTALARRAAQKGAGVGAFSLEIERKEFTSRLAANAMSDGAQPVDYRDILASRLTIAQVEILCETRRWLGALPLKLCEQSGLTMAQIESRALQMAKSLARQGRNLDVVLIDYLQLIQVTDRYRGKPVEELGEVALAAKNMAKRLNCCVVLLSQLNRGVEGRESKRPLLSDLRGSGNIEEHADAVGLLYRPAYYDKDDLKVRAGTDDALLLAVHARRHVLEIIWGKNRLGPTDTDSFYCNVGRSQVDDLARGREA